MEGKLEKLFRSNDHNSIIQSCQSLITEVIANSSSNTSDLILIFEKLVAEDTQLHISKPILVFYSSAIKSLNNEAFEELAMYILKSRKLNNDEAEYFIRDHLFDILVSFGQFADAAQILSAMNLESATRVFSDAEKVDIYVKCAEAFLEEDCSIEAETFVNKASQFLNNIQDTSLLLRYRVNHARVLDANRKFIEASLRYYELSSTTSINVVKEELLELLGKAVTCAILGKTGQQRNRILGLLYNDQRISNLDQLSSYASHSTILTKMFKEQIIKKEDLSAFELSLQDHQKATTPEGFTILEKAVIEHNLLATSRIYDNIYINQLASILLIDERRAEKIAANMIVENRLRATIDQIEGLLVFKDSLNSIEIFDQEIATVCHDVSTLVSAIQ